MLDLNRLIRFGPVLPPRGGVAWEGLVVLPALALGAVLGAGGRLCTAAADRVERWLEHWDDPVDDALRRARCTDCGGPVLRCTCVTGEATAGADNDCDGPPCEPVDLASYFRRGGEADDA